jgi:hypothetical protein
MATSAPVLDCTKSVASYLNKILRPRDKAKEIPGIKALLLDRETVSIFNVAWKLLPAVALLTAMLIAGQRASADAERSGWCCLYQLSALACTFVDVIHIDHFVRRK